MTTVEIALAALSAASTVAQGVAANNTARAQAQAMRQNADIIRQRAAVEEDKYRRQTSKLLGRQRALFANAGVNLDGSPLLAQEETAANAELEALTMRHTGDLEAANQLNQAMLTRLKGRTALVSGFTGAGESLLGSYVSYDREQKRLTQSKPATPSGEKER
ncbi:MAG TPA: hypothetical protein VFS04_06570 [Alphaproteobacteria bacterium]|nr:hypothetical protein [Alphaproteobacteria bacterium]